MRKAQRGVAAIEEKTFNAKTQSPRRKARKDLKRATVGKGRLSACGTSSPQSPTPKREEKTARREETEDERSKDGRVKSSRNRRNSTAGNASNAMQSEDAERLPAMLSKTGTSCFRRI